jgi:hypothetical protein
MGDDLDKITWGEYKRSLESKSSKTALSGKKGFTRDKLIQVVQASDMQGCKMFVWVECLSSYVRVYRNSMVESIKKLDNPEHLTVRKDYKEVYFK